jgi:hypothetical protein
MKNKVTWRENEKFENNGRILCPDTLSVALDLLARKTASRS